MRAIGILAILLSIGAFAIGAILAIARDPTSGLVILAAAGGLFWTGLALFAVGSIVRAIHAASDRTVAALRAGPPPTG